MVARRLWRHWPAPSARRSSTAAWHPAWSYLCRGGGTVVVTSLSREMDDGRTSCKAPCTMQPPLRSTTQGRPRAPHISDAYGATPRALQPDNKTCMYELEPRERHDSSGNAVMWYILLRRFYVRFSACVGIMLIAAVSLCALLKIHPFCTGPKIRQCVNVSQRRGITVIGTVCVQSLCSHLVPCQIQKFAGCGPNRPTNHSFRRVDIHCRTVSRGLARRH